MMSDLISKSLGKHPFQAFATACVVLAVGFVLVNNGFPNALIWTVFGLSVVACFGLIEALKYLFRRSQYLTKHKLGGPFADVFGFVLLIFIPILTNRVFFEGELKMELMPIDLGQLFLLTVFFTVFIYVVKRLKRE